MKKAVVIGAGVAGMAAAVRLSKEGFQVSLYEASDHLGGKLSQRQLPLLSSTLPDKSQTMFEILLQNMLLKNLKMLQRARTQCAVSVAITM